MNYSYIEGVLNTAPPPLLFHYTSPAGFIGMVLTKKIWATHVRYLNDHQEVVHAVQLAKDVVTRTQESLAGIPTKDDRHQLLGDMVTYLGTASSDVYVASLTEQRDLLSQWRAYCPPGGGYALGVSSDQLRAVCNEQGFYIAPCVYDQDRQTRMVKEIFDAHYQSALRAFEQTPVDDRPEHFVRDLAVTFCRELAKFGAILKHHSFAEEREWRLIASSPGVDSPRIMHRAGPHSIIPYLEFNLATSNFPDLLRKGTDGQLTAVAGPTRDRDATSFAMQSLLHKGFPGVLGGFWMGQSECPYRGN